MDLVSFWEAITTASCGNFDPGVLVIELDGVSYEFSGADEWEYIEFCFTPSSSTIELAMYNGSDAFVSLLVVDSPDCDFITPCCTMELEVEEEELELCPGEEVQFVTSYYQESGNVVIEWTSEPSDGVNYLNDNTISSPIFSFPNNDEFEGETYIFTVSVTDENCTRSEIIELTVNPNEQPEFDFELCELSEEEMLPTESENGFVGDWDGDFDFEFLAGTSQEYTFTLSPGQNNCTSEWTYTFFIEPAIELSFQEESFFCVLDDAEYELPDESLEGIDGEWDMDSFSPESLGAGYHQFVFTPDLSEACALAFEFEILVEESDSIQFNLPSEFCAQDEIFSLPDTSLSNVPGEWNQPFIDLSEIVSSESIVFTPDEEVGCYSSFTYSYSIQEDVEVMFEIDDSICRDIGIISLDSLSVNGFLGYWTPGEIQTDTIDADSINFLWQPLGTDNSCVTDTLITIHIRDDIDPFFDLELSLCESFGEYQLPEISENGIEGVWIPSSINTLIEGPGIVQLEFKPNPDQCSSAFSWEIEILENDSPLFSIPAELCQNAAPFDLPDISDNGINGEWSISNITPQNIIDSLVLTFTPSDAEELCLQEYQHTIYISDVIEPEFNLPEYLCSSDGTYQFSENSIEGVPGTWDLGFVDPTEFEGIEIVNNSFIPDDLSCYLPVDWTLEVINIENYEVSIEGSEFMC